MRTFLETKRLLLKFTAQSDFDDLFALRSDPDVMKYIRDGRVQTQEEVQRFLDVAIPYEKKHGFGFCSVFEKESDAYVGQAGLLHIGLYDEQPDIEIGYRLHKQFWGKGYATELTNALIQWGFEHLSVTKFVAFAHPDNKQSHRVLQKCGMRYLGVMESYYGKLPTYEIEKDTRINFAKANDPIYLVPYDPQWPEMAALEIANLRKVLPIDHIIDIQHVGSTAVPGIYAKPIIDIQIAVDSLVRIKQIAIDKLKTLGYEYWYDNPDPERMFFVKGMPPFGEKRTHHVHIVESTSRHWEEKIQFRDYLLSHPEMAYEYENLKIQLANQHTDDREKYTDAKTQLIKEILQKAHDVGNKDR